MLFRSANYHTKIADELCCAWGANDQGMPFLLVDSNEGQLYMHDALIAAEYASVNRKAMMEALGTFICTPIDTIESVHNYISPTGMIRKGATSAQEGERVIIPFNMRDGLAICMGKGNKKYNFSAPHGAGRILSRTKAKEKLDVNNFRSSMEQAGVYTSTANESTLDEAPEAYKDMNVILENIKETVDVIELIKPIYNFKASKEDK